MFRKRRWPKAELTFAHEREMQPVPIVGDGALANPHVQSRTMIPALLVDTSDRPDIEQLIDAHISMEATGDVTTRWGKIEREGYGPIQLIMQFVRPVACTIVLDPDIGKYGGTIDQLIASEALYLFYGRLGDRVSSLMPRQNILVQVEAPDELRREWDRLLDQELRSWFRLKGLSRGQAKQASRNLRSEWRQLWERSRLGG